MWIAITSVMIGLVFLATGVPKLLGVQAAVENVTRYGYGEGFARLVGLGEVAAAAALAWGVTDPRGTLVGAGLAIAILLGALHAHLVVGKDPFARWAPPASLLVLAALLLGATLAG